MRNGRNKIVNCVMKIKNVLKMQYMVVPCTGMEAVLYIYICATDVGRDGVGEV